MSITREQILESLHTDWGTFVDRFQRLSPEAQAAYLHQQGYARFADLLAHIIAWWREGLQAIPVLLDDPSYASPDRNVDVFNAQAVASCRDLNEPTIIALFEDLRQRWLQQVSELSDETWQSKKINERLHIELIGHYEEHRL